MGVWEVDIRGSKWEIEAPSEDQAATWALKLAQQPQHFELGQAPGQTPLVEKSRSMVSDIANSIVSGGRTAGEGLLGMAGDVPNLVTAGSGWLAKKLGEDPEVVDRYTAQQRADNPLPTSADINAATTPYVGESYQSETVPGAYAKTATEFLPAMVSGPGSMASRLGRQVALPAIGAETAGQMSDQNPYARLVGAMLGGVVNPSRLVTPLPAGPERRAFADTLSQEGVDLTAGQRTGSKGLRAAESQIGGGAAERVMENQGEQFTRAALTRAGIDAHRATPEVMDQAFRRIGDEFNNLAGNTTIPLDQTLQNALLTDVLRYQQTRGAGAVAPIVEDIMNDISQTAAKNGGSLPGEAFRRVRTRLTDSIREGADDTKGSLRDMLESLDDAVERTMPQDMVERWQTARRQYRNMFVLERAATGAGENAAAGIISPSALRNATVSQHGRRNYARGQGDFAELARAGEGTMKPLPDSGTARNMSARNLGTGLMSVLGGGAGSLHSPEAAMAGVLIGGGLPPLAGRALMSGPVQGFLGNQVLAGGGPQMNPLQRAFISALLAAQQGGRAIVQP